MDKNEYDKIVMITYNNLAMGNLIPTLSFCEKWVARQFNLKVGGKAMEVAYDALTKFGVTP